ncbi:lipoprotein-releasing system permease protein [Aquabacterium commune]|uniref:Lipoprotein-releasing system permease protein n=1 Tax=Aquabacterium commune TaxID=70586 RepID=A0A4R6R5Z3_9BURK|nr:FtsX-like permease family protein [Aquabacterium commune]TDP80966.1 lipoprotein-releasing system permease protein [Aquabacterium commune]
MTQALPLAFEFSVALRFLREGRFQSLLIIVGVAAGVAVVAYISALVTGLQTNTLNKTLGAQAHIVISPPDERVAPAWPVAPGERHASETQARAQRLRTIANWPAVDAAMSRRAGITAVSPMTSGAALARRGEATRAIALTGVDLARYDRIVNLREKLVAGSFRIGPGEAIVGKTLAEDLGVRVGDRITLSTDSRSDSVRINGLVDLGIKDLNRRVVIVPQRSAQSLLDLTGGATQIDLRVNDVWAAQALAASLARELPCKVESWQDANTQLVTALNAQSISTTLIRSVVMVVVVLGIASVLVVSVVQKQREIGILRAMGAQRAQVLRIFLIQGGMVGLLGSVLGAGIAMGMIKVFTTFVRGADGLPLFSITLPPETALQTMAMALAAGLLAAVAPARRAARMDPAQAIRM